MSVRIKCAIAVVGMFATIPQMVRAAEYRVTYSGKITDGSDAGNTFGLFGQNLEGLGLRADLTYTTSVPGTRTSSRTSDEVSGGDAFGTAPVLSSAMFTIGSASFTFSPSYYGDVYTSPDFISAYGYDVLGNSLQTYIVPDSAAPANLQTLFRSTGKGDTGGASTQYSYLVAGNSNIDFNATNVMVAAVPEPATWAMMLAGFTAIGLTLRRRGKRFSPQNGLEALSDKQ
ncbi:PEPxxWA-CTERM sorting domain-containing protein [Sphingomonas sp. BAUL-RG-20F-R05-02]|uniref:PEPxxWA-CTERM sorting domain-containing protein n=1 Tax=Sphingomonas sp. BAUL-RG-20F-R05-02 TaxID=2914830 RepID=UPI001F566863|nr:PEPxxWA-CTERM sorting domain-containing protein [Sphingomonas sp. BAUL-RG-20F-R05-02]